MKIGVLETGPVAQELQDRFGTYGRFFETMLSPHMPDANFTNYAVHEDIFPDAPTDADAWVVTGSKYGAYEDHPWIPPLEAFLRDSIAAGVPVAGICFGHQILAQALGGKVVKSGKGWGLGVHDYKIVHAPSWMEGAQGSFASHAVHQDQVVALPPDATVIATSDFCEFAAIAYGDAENPTAISVQPHPEFGADFVDGLVRTRRGTVFDDTVADTALQTLGAPVNNEDWGRWIARYFESRSG